ncbi:carbohydrate-binding domain-containing protein [bacterium]|nr:carbohydrate-binding domain-containing protein [bacterium]
MRTGTHLRTAGTVGDQAPRPSACTSTSAGAGNRVTAAAAAPVSRRAAIVGGVVVLGAGLAGSAALWARASDAAETSVVATADATSAGMPPTGGAAGGVPGEQAAVSTASSAMVARDDLLDTSDLFTERDLEQTPDLSAATTLAVTDGQDVTVTTEGVYVLSGTATDASIVVAATDAKVQLVLSGLSVTNADAPAIYVKDADKVFVTTTGDVGSALGVTGAFVPDGETDLDAVIWSASDLTLNGTGTLALSAAQGHGVACKDDLAVTGGTYDVTSGSHGLKAHDSVRVCGGSLTIDAGSDGIHAEDADDDTTGFVYVSGGDLSITAASQGIRATTVAMIDGGTLDVSAAEGIEATYVQVNDGTIAITASDDGVNATANSQALGVVAEFNGGDVTIQTGAGDTDAVDANGSIYVNGGTLAITSPTSAFDFDQTGVISGGTVTVNGEQVTEMPSGMAGRAGGAGGRAGGAGAGAGQAAGAPVSRA